MDEWMNGQMDGRMYRWMDGQMDKWMGIWMSDGWTGGRMNGKELWTIPELSPAQGLCPDLEGGWLGGHFLMPMGQATPVPPSPQ